MTIGEVLILVFVTIAFIFGIWGGLKLFKWNTADRANLEEKNKNKTNSN